MFLPTLLERNAPLAEFALDALRRKELLPDTFVLDMDALEENAALILAEAGRLGLSLYCMLKQLGRIPAVGSLLTGMGFAGVVCVDFREALTMLEYGVPLGNVGHLVQTPKAALEKILTAQPDIMTIYSLEKAREIGAICQNRGRSRGKPGPQAVMLRVHAPGDVVYPGQQGGFLLEDLEQSLAALETIKGIVPAGVCAFPCLLYDADAGEVLPTPNLATVQKAAALLRSRGYENIQVNLPSVSCVHTLPLIAGQGGTHAEPGHALTGTTPYHAGTHKPSLGAQGLERDGQVRDGQERDCQERNGQVRGGRERPALAYVTEISHNSEGRAYCYGGGHYRRGGLARALTGDSLASAVTRGAFAPSPESIDYHFALEGEAPVSQGVLMCFRSQVFVTRSEVALVRGLSRGAPCIESLWSSQGLRKQ